MLLFAIYYLLSPIIYIILYIYSFFNKKIYVLIKEQKNSLNKIKTKLNTSKKKILIHAASAGEYEQIKPILRIIDRNIYFTVISCTSPTIYDTIKKDCLSDAFCYHPFDLPWLAKNFLNSIKPVVYLTTRHDVWPIHLYYAKKANIKTMIINANLYNKSKRLKWYSIKITKYIYSFFDSIIVPSQSIGNIFNKKLKIINTYIISDTRFEQILHRKSKSNGIPNLESIYSLNNIIFGSVSMEDIKLFNNKIYKEHISYLFSKKKNKINWILIVPHEIDPKLIRKIESIFPNAIKYSNIKNNILSKNGVLIVDKIGILPELYKYTKVAYVGGGFGKGVHSTTEPLIYDNIVCYGPNIDLLDEAKEMCNNKCGIIINNGSDIIKITKRRFDKDLINNDDKIMLDTIRINTFNYINKKNQSSEKIYDIIKKYA